MAGTRRIIPFPTKSKFGNHDQLALPVMGMWPAEVRRSLPAPLDQSQCGPEAKSCVANHVPSPATPIPVAMHGLLSRLPGVTGAVHPAPPRRGALDHCNHRIGAGSRRPHARALPCSSIPRDLPPGLVWLTAGLILLSGSLYAYVLARRRTSGPQREEIGLYPMNADAPVRNSGAGCGARTLRRRCLRREPDGPSALDTSDSHPKRLVMKLPGSLAALISWSQPSSSPPRTRAQNETPDHRKSA
jgi:hypothetical protein